MLCTHVLPIHNSPIHSRSLCFNSSPEKTARPDVLVNGKREKSDVPDPPMEVISTAVNHVMSLSSANHVMSQSPYMVSQSPANHVMSPHVVNSLLCNVHLLCKMITL